MHGRDQHAAFIAGGTDLIGLMKDRATLPAHVIDINALPGTAEVIARADGIGSPGASAPEVIRVRMSSTMRS